MSGDINIYDDQLLNVETYLPKYPNIDDKNFYQDIFRKEEYYSQLASMSSKPSVTSESKFFAHQKIIQRFLSSHTLYNELLLFHGLGSGKSCSAIAVAEAIKYLIQKDGKQGELYFNPVLVIVKNRILRTNMIDQLVRTCTSNEYVRKLEELEDEDAGKELPDDIEAMFDDEAEIFEPDEEVKKGRRKVQVEFSPEETEEIMQEKDLVSRKYKFRMMGAFANEINSLMESNNEDEIIEKYSNRIIIIDEAHNLRDGEDTKYYNIYMNFLHLVKNCKILLLTGTPMVDTPKDMVSLMNLILPKDRQLDEDDVENPEEFKEKVRGRISYVRESGEVPKRIDEGIVRKPFQYFKIVYSEMSEFQYEAYKKTVKSQGKKKFSNDARHAANFVFSDGNSGVSAETKFLHVKGSKGIIQSERKKIAENIQKYSAKFSKIAETLKDPKYEKELAFIFSDYVAGGGTTLLYYSLLGQGFSAFTGSSGKGKNRIAVITHNTLTEERNNIIEKFRSPENKYGEYIRVLIGSRAISEGVDLKNVRQVHVLAPHWNNSVTEQAIGRGIRMGSHKDLSPDERYVRVFRHASTKPNIPKYKKDDDTIDIYLYKLSETKDIEIGKITRLSQEVAIDCGLNYVRNHISDTAQNYSRACQYQVCEYHCDGLDDYAIRDKNGTIRYEASPDLRDYSTWIQFYSDNDVKNAIEKIVSLFRVKSSYSLAEISDNYPEFLTPIILEALRRIIDSRIPLKNMLGLPLYLIESENIYYLQQTWSSDINQSPLLSYYGSHAFVSVPTSFEQMVNELKGEIQLQNICPISSEKAISKKRMLLFIEKLEYSNKLAVLEFVLGKHYSGNDSDELSKMATTVIKEHFSEYIDDENKSHNYYSLDYDPDDKETIRRRCYDTNVNEWLFCDERKISDSEIKRKKLTKEGRIRREIKQTTHLAPDEKVVGTVDGDGVFRIVDRFTYSSKRVKQSAKGKVCTGKAGGGWNIPPLAKLISRLPINLEESPYDYGFPHDEVDMNDVESLRQYILENTKVKFDNEPAVVDESLEITDELMKELQTYVTIIYNMAEKGGHGVKKEDLCGIVRDYLDDNGLLFKI